ncbi:MAG: DNA repair protein RecO [Parachlamydiaceae bacterium]
MDKLTTQGVIIGALPFREYDCILSLFTPYEGLIKLFSKGAYRKGKAASPVSPLTQIEVIYAKGRTELHPCHEITAINHNLPLRQNLAVLQTACEMLHAIKVTQQPGKPAPELYQLFLTYLHKLPAVASPVALGASFRLKLLRHEGLIGMLSHCAVCGTMLDKAWIYEGEVFCHLHHPSHATVVDTEEYDLALVLLYSREFSLLTSLTISPELAEKINGIFEERTQ